MREKRESDRGRHCAGSQSSSASGAEKPCAARRAKPWVHANWRHAVRGLASKSRRRAQEVGFSHHTGMQTMIVRPRSEFTRLVPRKFTRLRLGLRGGSERWSDQSRCTVDVQLLFDVQLVDVSEVVGRLAQQASERSELACCPRCATSSTAP